MEQSPRLSLSYVKPQQAQKHVTVNESFRRLDILVQMNALSRSISAEPLSPSEGAAYILPAGKSGAVWSSFADHTVAAFQDGAWTGIAAREGFLIHVADEDAFISMQAATGTPFQSERRNRRRNSESIRRRMRRTGLRSSRMRNY